MNLFKGTQATTKCFNYVTWYIHNYDFSLYFCSDNLPDCLIYCYAFIISVWVERRRRLAIKRFGGVKDEFAQQPEGHVTLSSAPPGGGPMPQASGYHSSQQVLLRKSSRTKRHSKIRSGEFNFIFFVLQHGIHMHHHQGGSNVYGDPVFGGSRLR